MFLPRPPAVEEPSGKVEDLGGLTIAPGDHRSPRRSTGGPRPGDYPRACELTRDGRRDAGRLCDPRALRLPTWTPPSRNRLARARQRDIPLRRNALPDAVLLLMLRLDEERRPRPGGRRFLYSIAPWRGPFYPRLYLAAARRSARGAAGLNRNACDLCTLAAG